MRHQRVLAVVLPAFRLERCGWSASEIAGVIAEVKNAMRLVALTPAASDEGLTLGMTAAAARSLVPEVILELLDSEAEQADRAALTRSLDTLSDRVGVFTEDTWMVEISGVRDAHGGESETVSRARALVTSLGHCCRLAVADDPLAAYALARQCDGDPIAGPGDAATHLAPLPLHALAPSVALHSALSALGLDTIGAFAKLEPASVAGRFGAEGVCLHRVARGRASAHLHADWGGRPAGPLLVRMPLGGATSTLQIQFALPGLLAQLADLLAGGDLAAMRLSIGMQIERGWSHEAAEDTVSSRVRIGVTVGRPTRSPSVLQPLIVQRLEGLQLAGPVEELSLEVTEAVADPGWQPGLADRVEAREPLPDLLARLSDHLGEGTCFAAELVDSWRPEAAWKTRTWPPRTPHAARSAGIALGRVPTGVHSDDPVEVLEAWEQCLPFPRPALLLPEPVPMDVQTGPSGCPRTARLPDRGWVTVSRQVGPERLSGEWWDPEYTWSRDYWVIEVNRCLAWIFQDRRTRRWALHGWF